MNAASLSASHASGHSDTYRKLITALLGGAVVCQWSMPSESRLMEKPEIQSKINAWVSDLGMELAETSSGRGHYLVYRGFDPTVKLVAREMFTRVMKDLRFYVRMLEMLMNSLHEDMTLVAGEELHFHDLLSQVGQSPSLQSQLGELYSSKKHNAVKEQLESLFQRLQKDGLLVEANAKHSIFQVTARIELVQDLIIFIQENEHLPEPETDALTAGQRLMI
jgi:hypothetical protein